MIGQRFNFEDVFFRDLTVCVLDTLEGQVKWINRFSSGDRFVNVPFYYSLSGDERFLLDSFSDDIISENRFVELNTDIIPRGHLTMTGFNIKSDEFANPNVWLRMVVENEFEIRKVLAKVRAIPITVNYDLEIRLSSEIDTFKCSQAIMDTLWVYKFMYFEHNFLNIDAVILMPDTNSIEMSREKNLSSDNDIKLKCSFTVETYYPAFRRDKISDVGYPQFYGPGVADSVYPPPTGTGMTDLNGYDVSGGVSDFFSDTTTGGSFGDSPGSDNTITSPISAGNPPFTFPPFSNPTIPISIGTVGNAGTTPGITSSNTNSNIGGTNIFNNTQASTSPSDPYGTFTSPEYFATVPRRTRWFNNILRSRERARGTVANPNAQDPNPNNNGASNSPINGQV